MKINEHLMSKPYWLTLESGISVIDISVLPEVLLRPRRFAN